jgi:hypothetical protein
MENDPGTSADLTAIPPGPPGPGLQEEDRPPTASPTVFISYRHDPDEPLAAALKLLIERSIDPRPTVFAAGNEGLRPSRIGFRAQLQNAVRNAKAFVAILTPSSIDREWVYFEAGAAWGRDQLYAPLLIGTTSSDLSTTIAEYQATHADHEQSMKALMQAIAEAVGCETKSRFGPRYAQFLDALRSHAGESSSTPSESLPPPSAEDANPLLSAWSLATDGRQAEAEARFHELENAETQIAARAQIRLYAIRARTRLSTGTSTYEQIVALPEAYKNTPAVSLQLGLADYYTPRAIDTLRRTIATFGDDVDTRRFGFLALAARLGEAQPSQAIETYLECLRDGDGHLRSQAAEQWARSLADKKLFRMLVLGYGFRARSTANILREAADLAIEENWPSLAVRFAHEADKQADGDEEANRLGRAYHSAQLFSVAYQAYSRAASAGVQVATINMAALVHRYAVPAAGLALVETLQGNVGSADPAYPFAVRADLQHAVATEQRAAKTLLDTGIRLVRLLNDTFQTALSAATSVPTASAYRVGDATLAPTQTSTGFTLSAPSGAAPPVIEGALGALVSAVSRKEYRFTTLCEGLPLWHGRIEDRSYLLTLTADASLVGVGFTDLEKVSIEVTPAMFSSAKPEPTAGPYPTSATR